MTTTTVPRLINHAGRLYTAFEDIVCARLKQYFEIPGVNPDPVLFFYHPGGDMDTIRFPDYDAKHLRRALFDARETGQIDDVPMVLLPDGTEFLIDG